MYNKVKFNISCEVDEMFAPILVAMLKRIEQDGNRGHSEFVGIFTDGDGTDKATFKFDKDFEEIKPNISDDRKNFSKLGNYPEIGTYFGSGMLDQESWSMHYYVDDEGTPYAKGKIRVNN